MRPASQSPPDRSRPPAPGPRRPFRFPDFTVHRLENGLALYLVPGTKVPLVSAELLLPAGAQHDRFGGTSVPGLARLAAEMLDEGTAGHSAMELAERVEDLGGSLDTGCGWNMASVAVDLLSRHLDAGLELVAQTALDPTFPDDELERLRDETLAELIRRRDLPSARASEVFARAVYGDTPYGTPIYGTEESVGSISRDEIRAFYEAHAVPAGSALLVAGDFDPEVVRERVEALFGRWTGGPEPADPEIEPRALDGREVHLVDRPGAAQSVLQVGCAGPPRSAEDFRHLLLGHVIFGGNFSSRINLSLRERHGYTYGAKSALRQRRGPGPFFVRTNVATEHLGAAAREIFAELERLREEPPTAEEMEDSREYLLGVFPTTVQRVTGRLARLEALVVHRLPDDYYDDYAERLLAITADDVRAAAERHLDPDRFVVVAVGPADELRPQLEGLGAEVQVHGAAA